MKPVFGITRLAALTDAVQEKEKEAQVIRYVLSVGGARGSFQAGALWYLHNHGFEGGHYYGHSVGALNGVMCAMRAHNALYHTWETIEDNTVYRHRFSAARAAWAALRNRAMLDTDPLYNLIKDELADRSLFSTFTTGFVDLSTGKLKRKTYTFGSDELQLALDVYASAAIPFAFPLVNNEADGGLIEPIPLSPAIQDAGEDDIFVIISCHPLNGLDPAAGFKSPISTLPRTLDIMQHTLLKNSVEPFLLINRLAENGPLTDPETGRTYRKFKCVTIAPDRPLPWGMVDFSASKAGLRMGIEAAQSVIDQLHALTSGA